MVEAWPRLRWLAGAPGCPERPRLRAVTAKCARGDRCHHVSRWPAAVAAGLSSGCEPGWLVWSRAFGCAMRREVQQARYTGFAAEGRRLATSGKPRIRV